MRLMNIWFVKNILVLIFFVILATSQSQAARFIALGGFGEAKSTSAGTTAATRLESPGGISFAIDQQLGQQYQGAYYIFAEHMRSLGSTGTSVGFTGLGIKFYPWLSPSSIGISQPGIRSQMTFTGYVPYLGAGFGFAQSSILGNTTQQDVLAVGGYVSIKGGVEYPMSATWGLLSEGNYMMSVAGSGKIEALNVLFGCYFSF